MVESDRAQSTRLMATVVVAALAVSLAACSSSSGGKAAPKTPTSSSSSSGFPASSSPATSSSTPAASETVTPADLTSALLTPADIGLTGATSSPASTTDHPLPCDPPTAKSLNQQVPATVRAGVDISDDPQKAAFAEEIRLYTDTATALSALTAAKAGLNCTSGSLRADDGTAVPVQIAAPKDISADLAKDTKLSGVPIAGALVWSATAAGETIDLVVVQINRSLALFTFQAASDANLNDLPNPETVIEAGLEKIVSS